MHPIHFEGAQIVGKPENMTDEQCYSLWAMKHDYSYTGVDGKEYESRIWIEMWQPSKEDIEAIVGGRPIILQINSHGLPPVALFTLNENGDSNNE